MGSRALALVVVVGSLAVGVEAEEVEVVLREGTNFAAALSPNDGAFVLDLQGTLWRLSPDGGAATPLTDGLGDDRLPHVSKDGTRVVFQSFRRGTWDIWSMAHEGRASRLSPRAASTTESPSCRLTARASLFPPTGPAIMTSGS